MTQPGREAESFSHDSEQQVRGTNDPNLSFDGVLGSAEEHFDTKMLLETFEEQLNLQPESIEPSDRDWSQREVVDQEDQSMRSGSNRNEPQTSIFDSQSMPCQTLTLQHKDGSDVN